MYLEAYKRWMETELEDAALTAELESIAGNEEEIKTKKILTTNEKYYCIDPGFYEIQTGFNKSRGKILENIVFLELLRRNYKITIGNIDGLEVDFICQRL